MSAAFIEKRLQVELPKPAHECPTCYLSHSLRVIQVALERIDGATEGWLDDCQERDMAFYWLRDEVEAVLKQPWWKPSRRRLREAIRITKRP